MIQCVVNQILIHAPIDCFELLTTTKELMSRLSMFLVCLCSCVFITGCDEVVQTQVAAPTAALSQFRRPNNPEFVSEVYESDIPVLVDFGAEWCGPCQMLKPILHRMETEYEGRLKIVTIDTDEQPALAMHYEISGIPALFLFDDGELVAMEVGAPTESQLRQWIEANVDTSVVLDPETPAGDESTADTTAEESAANEQPAVPANET